jgi:hypothetical protein
MEYSRRTSEAVVPRAGQSTRERMLNKSFGSDSSVSLTSSQSLGCSGKAADVDLHALTAQVRKLSVRIFMVVREWGGDREQKEVVKLTTRETFLMWGWPR